MGVSDATTTCNRCDGSIPDHRDSLSVTLDGYGDCGFIDPFDAPAPRFELCRACAIGLFEREPWLMSALAHLNINVGHRCDQRPNHPVVWEAESTCSADPDRHGWRTVWLVRPTHPLPLGERPPLIAPQGGLAHFGVFDTEQEATVRATEVEALVPCRVAEWLLGNVQQDAELVDPEQWQSWFDLHLAEWSLLRQTF